MARTRRKHHKDEPSTSTPATRRSALRNKARDDGSMVPDVFQDLLSEATASKTAGTDEDSKPLKKRRIAEPIPGNHSSAKDPQPTFSSNSTTVQSQSSSFEIPAETPIVSKDPDNWFEERGRLQTIEISSESEDSDLEWEDALGFEEETNQDGHEEDKLSDVRDLSLTIGEVEDNDKSSVKRVKRRGITSVEKKLRLDIHKMHILCLLYHVHLRNTWCDDNMVHAALRKLPARKTLASLIPDPEHSQYQSSKQFMSAMQELKALWTDRFSIVALGMHKPRWADADAEVQQFSEFDELDDPMDRRGFRKAALSLRGSQDVGAQLFCALLRSIGVDARLVCSLQCLPFASAAQGSTPQKPSAQNSTLYLDPYNKERGESPSKPKSTQARPKRLSRLERVLGERHPALSSGVAPKQPKKYHTPYPVYWVEAFNIAQQKWIPIDPLSTFTVDRPEKLEPPLNHSQNSLVYAVAFEEGSSAKDVTRRYSKAYNAKTRKFRVDCVESGSRWWRRALKPFRRRDLLDRDQVEDAALARKEAAEGMPKNVQDFKNHPIYVLERHLKHNEIIHPMHSVGKVNVGTAMNPKMESIHRRKDVHIVRSADKWYRLGRDVIEGEQPLKHAKPRKTTRNNRQSIPPETDYDEQQDEIAVGLYAEFQTALYIPPPVVDGHVPRNAFGNLDVYVPSMVPEGGYHIRHKLASKAARILGVDYADAVTGFQFKGRHGTAVVQGIVTALEYREAIEEVIDAMQYAQEQMEQSQRSIEALRMWRRFYLGLQIAQRINAIEIDGETGPVVNVQEEIEKEDKALTEQQLAGGFFVEEGSTTEPTISSRRHHRRVVESDEEVNAMEDPDVGLMCDTNRAAAQPLHEDTEHNAYLGSPFLAAQQLRPRQGDDSGGGFISDHDDSGGGFIPDHNDSSGGFFPDHDAFSGGFSRESPPPPIGPGTLQAPLENPEAEGGHGNVSEQVLAMEEE